MTNNGLPLLPLGTSSFTTLRLRNQIYVDKTRLVYELAYRPEKFFIARPRRFGKSLLISTFESLFKFGLRDFKGLAIEKLWKDETQYKVVRLDFSEIKNFSDIEDFSQQLFSLLGRKFAFAGFPYDKNNPTEVVDQLSDWLEVIDGNSLVLLIDEYDAPLTACLNKPELFDEVRTKLARFYSIIKANDAAVRFFFMTGITKFNKTSIFSELNNLSDITLNPVFGTLLGYTAEEVEKYFGGYLTQASELLGLDRKDLMEKLTKHYDGFCFEFTAKQDVFAPWSLLKFFSFPELGLIDYWFESGGRPTALLEYMKSHYLRNPEEYGAEKSIALSTLSDSSDLKNLTDIGLLTQAGYLTIKSVRNRTAYVDYPNVEVRTAMANLYLEQMLSGKTIDQVGAGNIVSVLASESAESVFHIFNKLFKSIDYQQYPIVGESLVRTIVQVYLDGAGLSPRVEVHGHKGRSDLEVKSGNRHWVFELKVTGKGDSVEAKLTDAIKQITGRNYGNPDIGYELKRMALVFSLEEREFVKWVELPPDQ